MAEQHGLPPFRGEPMTDGFKQILSDREIPLPKHETHPDH